MANTSGFSVYLDNKLLDLLFNGTAYTTPSKYVALFSTDAGLSTNAPTGELSGGGYNRVKMKDSAFNAATSGLVTNNTEVTFPVATESWGTITHVGIMDALTDGNVLAWATITTPDGTQPMPKNITTADQFVIRANGIKFSIRDSADL